MVQARKTRRHSRLNSSRKADPKGERFHLGGKRWRFPKDLSLLEVERRSDRLRELWSEQEQFCQTTVYVLASESRFDSDSTYRDLTFREPVKLLLEHPPREPGSVPAKATIPNHASADQSPFAQTDWLQRTVQRYQMVRGDGVVQWSPLTLWVAEQIKQGIKPILLPPWPELIASVCRGPHVDYRFTCLAEFISNSTEGDLPRTENLSGKDAFALLQALSKAYPSIPWMMYKHQIREVVNHGEALESQGNSLITRASPPTTDTTSKGKPSSENRRAISQAKGTFHQAVQAYQIKRRADFQLGEQLSGSAYHMLGLAEDFVRRQPDVPLAELDFEGCQQLYDFWRNRPPNLRTNKPLSTKHCRSHIGELERFFKWLHTVDKFGWKRPDAFDLIEKKVKRLDSDRRSIQEIEIPTFKVEELALLYKHALPVERLTLVWCLNCAHGAAELGRVEWQDLFLNQPHPWKKEGLELAGSEQDSWCGLFRPKTNVMGWWWLWPETVALVKWWQSQVTEWLGRDTKPTERIMLTRTGAPLYRDHSKNAQTAFANQWQRLLERVQRKEGANSVKSLPLGTLRDQMSNWLGSDENQAVLASVALAHGIPHKGDALLYKHYSNRPWSRLFQAQRQYRALLQPMFDMAPDPLSVN